MHEPQKITTWQRYNRIDFILLFLLILLCSLGLFTLYSASRQNLNIVYGQSLRMALGISLMFFIAYLPPNFLRNLTPWIYITGLILLILIFFIGIEVNGSHRWLGYGSFRFQPSEIMKIGIPMMVAWYLGKQKLPISYAHLFIALIICMLPSLAILRQPDLGTALMAIFSGLCVIFLAGLSLRFILAALIACAAALPLFWQFIMQPYQRQRVLTLFNPESDPLGAGYHIIQSKIAIGSGGLYGKGWLKGTQANLQFLPEATTDFIYAIASEEFGLITMALLLLIYFIMIVYCFHISNKGADSFSRLLGGSLTMNFFFCIFVNAGMVSGILPVVGVPLPFISYGGTSIVTLFASFGILMNINANRIKNPKTSSSIL